MQKLFASAMSMDDDSQPICHGFLYLLRKSNGLLNFSSRRWVKRFCWLQASRKLYFYRDQELRYLKGFISLDDSSTCEPYNKNADEANSDESDDDDGAGSAVPADHHKHKYIFVIRAHEFIPSPRLCRSSQSSTRKKYFLSAESKEDMERWITTINNLKELDSDDDLPHDLMLRANPTANHRTTFYEIRMGSSPAAENMMFRLNMRPVAAGYDILDNNNNNSSSSNKSSPPLPQSSSPPPASNSSTPSITIKTPNKKSPSPSKINSNNKNDNKSNTTTTTTTKQPPSALVVSPIQQQQLSPSPSRSASSSSPPTPTTPSSIFSSAFSVLSSFVQHASSTTSESSSISSAGGSLYPIVMYPDFSINSSHSRSNCISTSSFSLSPSNGFLLDAPASVFLLDSPNSSSSITPNNSNNNNSSSSNDVRMLGPESIEIAAEAVKRATGTSILTTTAITTTTTTSSATSATTKAQPPPPPPRSAQKELIIEQKRRPSRRESEFHVEILEQNNNNNNNKSPPKPMPAPIAIPSHLRQLACTRRQTESEAASTWPPKADTLAQQQQQQKQQKQQQQQPNTDDNDDNNNNHNNNSDANTNMPQPQPPESVAQSPPPPPAMRHLRQRSRALTTTATDRDLNILEKMMAAEERRQKDLLWFEIRQLLLGNINIVTNPSSRRNAATDPVYRKKLQRRLESMIRERLRRQAVELTMMLDKYNMAQAQAKRNRGESALSSPSHRNHNQSQASLNILRAAERGDVAAVTRILAADQYAVATRDPTDRSYPLHKAAQNNHVEVMKILLEHGASLDCTDYLQSTPLHWSASKGHQEASGFLAGNGATVNVRDKYGNSPLWLAVKNGHLQLAADLLLFGADIDFKRCDGCTILGEMCKKGTLERVKFLVEHGAKVNAKDEFKSSCLLSSLDNPVPPSAGGGIEITKFLLTVPGVNLKARDGRGQSILHRAVKKKIDPSSPTSSGYFQELFTLVQNADPHAFKEILLNDRDQVLFSTPLHIAVSTGNLEAVKALLQFGADPNVQDRMGDTPLHIAVRTRNSEIMSELHKAGAKYNVKNKKRETAKTLHHNIMNNNNNSNKINNNPRTRSSLAPLSYNTLSNYSLQRVFSLNNIAGRSEEQL